MWLGVSTSTADKLKLAAIASIAVAVLVLALKYLAYWVTGSVALYSDALESIVNLITAVVALYAIHVSAQPADRRHQFGHHKAEYFSAVLEGVLIVVAALLILHEAYDAFLHRALSEPLRGLCINASPAVNAGWSYFR
jgi:cation diffusion facilitator family transporter